MKRIAVAILNFNGSHFLQKFLPDVIRYSEHLADVVVIDNASTDDSLHMLRDKFPSVSIISLKENTGYAGGYNKGLKQLENPFYVLLNSDIEVTQGWLDHLVAYLDAHPAVAAVQPKIKSFMRRDHFEHAGACGGYIDRFGYPLCRGRIITYSEQDHYQYDQADHVFWSSGACMMIRKDAFRDAGGFDDDFFAHMEEIDLCWRLQYRGHRIAVDPSSVVYHVGGGTLNYQNPVKTYLNFRNNLFLLHKNYFSGNLFFLIIRRMKLDGIAAFVFLFTGKFSHFGAVFRAHMHYYRSLKTLREKRKQVNAMIVNRDLQGMYPGSIIWQFYIRRRKKYSQLPR